MDICKVDHYCFMKKARKDKIAYFSFTHKKIITQIVCNHPIATGAITTIILIVIIVTTTTIVVRINIFNVGQYWCFVCTF